MYYLIAKSLSGLYQPFAPGQVLRCAMAGLLIALLSGCATYSDWVSDMEYEIADGNTEGALDSLEKHLDNNRDQVLYLLNRAMLLRIDGQLDASNSVFEKAKALIENLTIISVSEQGGALSINEMMRSYTGEFYERVLLHVYAALNYLELGKPQEARVEALQLDALLNEFAKKGFYEDGFARYIGGMIYETLHEWDDALIDYRKAYQAYLKYPESYHMNVPEQLKYDLLRMTRYLGLQDEYEQYRNQWEIPADRPINIEPDRGEVVFLLHSGLAPLKYSKNISVVTSDGELVTISMPYYATREPYVTSAVVRDAERSVTAEMFENINAVALYTLDQQKPKFITRAIARALLKHQATETASDKNDTLGIIVNIAGVLSERADTRSWSTLPNRVYLARLPLGEGRHDIRVELRDSSNAVVITREYSFNLKRNEKYFISLHWIDDGDLVSLTSNPDRQERRH